MLHYGIQIILFQALFFLVYELFLKKETFFTGNRIYLLASQLLVLILPFLKFPTIQNKIPQQYQLIYTEKYVAADQIISANITEVSNNFSFQWEWIFYLGIGLSLVLFIIKIFKLYQLIKLGKTTNCKNFKIVSLPVEITPFSFWKYIFINTNLTKEKKDLIIKHECIHLQQKHSVDLLFFEILRILFWYNPFIIFYQKKIAEVHEYIVDNTISTKKISKKDYCQNLLSEVFQIKNLSFTNSFYNVSLVKKRIQMLTKMKSSNRKILKYFIAVPIFGFSVAFIACKNNSEPVAMLANINEWKTVNYKTGNNISCLNYTPQFQQTGNYLKITNNDPKKDAVLKVIHAKTETIYRDAYVKAGEEFTLKNIPLGDYYFKIALGNDWKEINVAGKCFGRFTKNVEYQHYRENRIYTFKITENPWSNYPESFWITTRDYYPKK